MNKIDVYVRYSANAPLQKAATFTKEGNLIYNDENHGFTLAKFAFLTAASPLIAVVRLVRSAVFVLTGHFERGAREFIGSLAVSVLVSACFTGTLLSLFLDLASCEKISFQTSMRRTYAYFEAWVNQIDLDSLILPTYAQRVSNPIECFGANRHIWTTAPCMQPILENGLSEQGGLLDRTRVQKSFFFEVKDLRYEEGKIVIQSEQEERNLEPH